MNSFSHGVGGSGHPALKGGKGRTRLQFEAVLHIIILNMFIHNLYINTTLGHHKDIYTNKYMGVPTAAPFCWARPFFWSGAVAQVGLSLVWSGLI